MHQRYIYACADRVLENKPIQVITHVDGKAQETEDVPIFYKEGYYVFNVQALLRGRVDHFKVTGSAAGLCNLVEYNLFNERLAYIEDYDWIIVIPIPHLNAVNCIGMENKHEHLIWREKKGFFTALDRRGILKTWSTLSGKLLYEMVQKKDASMKEMENYEVFRGNARDIAYTRNFYNLEDCSLNLLRSS